MFSNVLEGVFTTVLPGVTVDCLQSRLSTTTMTHTSSHSLRAWQAPGTAAPVQMAQAVVDSVKVAGSYKALK